MTAIQPSKLAIPDTNPQPYASVEGSIVVACMRCKRVYRFDTGYLQSRSTTSGVGPYNPLAPMRIFEVPIACGWVGCSAQLVVHAMLSSSTTAAETRKRKGDLDILGIAMPRRASVPLASLSRLTSGGISGTEVGLADHMLTIAELLGAD